MRLRHFVVSSLVLVACTTLGCTHNVSVQQTAEERAAIEAQQMAEMQRGIERRHREQTAEGAQTLDEARGKATIAASAAYVPPTITGPVGETSTQAISSGVARFLELMHESRPVTVHCKTHRTYSRGTLRTVSTCY
jgi:hypothetical protein